MNFLDLDLADPAVSRDRIRHQRAHRETLPKTVVGAIAAGMVLLSFIFSAGAVYQLLQLRSGASIAHRKAL